MHAAAANNDNATGAGRRSPSGGVPNSIKFGSHELQCGPSWFGWASFLGASTCSSSMQAPDHLRLPSATLVWSSSSLLMEQQYSRCENIGTGPVSFFCPGDISLIFPTNLISEPSNQGMIFSLHCFFFLIMFFVLLQASGTWTYSSFSTSSQVLLHLIILDDP